MAEVTAGEIASHVGGILRGDASAPVIGICSLGNLRPRCLAFVKSIDRLGGDDPTRSGVVLLVPSSADAHLQGTHICVDSPRLSFGLAVAKFFAPRKAPSIAQTACIDPSATIGTQVSIGENCVIGAEVVIGDGTEIRNNVVIRDRVVIGRECLIKSNSVIGEEGFGIEKDAEGRNTRVPHLGSVIIGDNVEIGALTTVASGTIDPTIVEDNAKVDDHVHIAHNCRIGQNAIITACAEVSGSVDIGRDVWLGPNCSIINGIGIAPGTLVGIGAVVTKAITVAGTYAGVPARLISSRGSG